VDQLKRESLISKKAEDKRLSMNSEMAEVVMVTDIDALHLAVKIACDEVSRYPVFFKRLRCIFILFAIHSLMEVVLSLNLTVLYALNSIPRITKSGVAFIMVLLNVFISTQTQLETSHSCF